MKIKAVLFDLDGTIANTLDSLTKACNIVLEEYGYPPIDSSKYRYFAGNGAKTLVERAFRASGELESAHWEEGYRRYCEVFESYCTYNVRVYDGMEEIIKALKEKGIKLAVVTNKPHLRALDVVNSLFPKGTFDVVLGQKDGCPKKPARDMPLKAMEMLGAAPSECIFAGDSSVDIKTGKNAGVFTIGVLWGFRDRKELEAEHADAVIERPGELLGYVY